mmetsp:Transcript_12223/g.33357  ORF Transcript_12223/g.33357 Transcript_12223/m.33357 type:complete len:330 (-) Transcript_12223:753-1742(-)
MKYSGTWTLFPSLDFTPAVRAFSKRQVLMLFGSQSASIKGGSSIPAHPSEHMYARFARIMQQHTKYNLVTKREACEGVGIAPELCDTLPFVISCGMPFYLRTAVLGLEAAQQSGRRTVQRAGAGVDSSEEEDEGDFQCCGDSDGMNGYMSGLEEHQASKEQAAAEKAAAAAARKAEDKATRKATKKQAKQDQRAKRQGGCTDPSPHKSAQSNLDLHTRQAEGAHSIPSGRPSRTSKGSSPSGSFWSQEGSSNGRQGAGPSARRAGGGTRSSFGGRSLPSRSRISTTPPLEGQARGLQRTPPRASGWLQEREAIMQEFGPYSISGLVLVS